MGGFSTCEIASRITKPRRIETPIRHHFIQPQLLAVLCLIRYEDWTFRETEVPLREHGELRALAKPKSSTLT